MNSGDGLTAITCFYIDGRVNYRLLFGSPVARKRINGKRYLLYFKSGSVLGYLRWRANEYGTQSWRCMVLRTGIVSSKITRLPGVLPGAEALFSSRGKTYSKRFLQALDGLKQHDHTLQSVLPAYWRQMQLRLHLNMPVHSANKRQMAAGRVKCKISL